MDYRTFFNQTEYKWADLDRVDDVANEIEKLRSTIGELKDKLQLSDQQESVDSRNIKNITSTINGTKMINPYLDSTKAIVAANVSIGSTQCKVLSLDGIYIGCNYIITNSGSAEEIIITDIHTNMSNLTTDYSKLPTVSSAPYTIYFKRKADEKGLQNSYAAHTSYIVRTDLPYTTRNDIDTFVFVDSKYTKKIDVKQNLYTVSLNTKTETNTETKITTTKQWYSFGGSSSMSFIPTDRYCDVGIQIDDLDHVSKVQEGPVSIKNFHIKGFLKTDKYTYNGKKYAKQEKQSITTVKSGTLINYSPILVLRQNIGSQYTSTPRYYFNNGKVTGPLTQLEINASGKPFYEHLAYVNAEYQYTDEKKAKHSIPYGEYGNIQVELSDSNNSTNIKYSSSGTISKTMYSTATLTYTIISTDTTTSDVEASQSKIGTSSSTVSQNLGNGVTQKTTTKTTIKAKDATYNTQTVTTTVSTTYPVRRSKGTLMTVIDNHTGSKNPYELLFETLQEACEKPAYRIYVNCDLQEDNFMKNNKYNDYDAKVGIKQFSLNLSTEVVPNNDALYANLGSGHLYTTYTVGLDNITSYTIYCNLYRNNKGSLGDTDHRTILADICFSPSISTKTNLQLYQLTPRLFVSSGDYHTERNLYIEYKTEEDKVITEYVDTSSKNIDSTVMAKVYSYQDGPAFYYSAATSKSICYSKDINNPAAMYIDNGKDTTNDFECSFNQATLHLYDGTDSTTRKEQATITIQPQTMTIDVKGTAKLNKNALKNISEDKATLTPSLSSITTSTSSVTITLKDSNTFVKPYPIRTKEQQRYLFQFDQDNSGIRIEEKQGNWIFVTSSYITGETHATGFNYCHTVLDLDVICSVQLYVFGKLNTQGNFTILDEHQEQKKFQPYTNVVNTDIQLYLRQNAAGYAYQSRAGITYNADDAVPRVASYLNNQYEKCNWYFYNGYYYGVDLKAQSELGILNGIIFDKTLPPNVMVYATYHYRDTISSETWYSMTMSGSVIRTDKDSMKVGFQFKMPTDATLRAKYPQSNSAYCKFTIDYTTFSTAFFYTCYQDTLGEIIVNNENLENKDIKRVGVYDGLVAYAASNDLLAGKEYNEEDTNTSINIGFTAQPVAIKAIAQIKNDITDQNEIPPRATGKKAPSNNTTYLGEKYYIAIEDYVTPPTSSESEILDTDAITAAKDQIDSPYNNIKVYSWTTYASVTAAPISLQRYTSISDLTTMDEAEKTVGGFYWDQDNMRLSLLAPQVTTLATKRAKIHLLPFSSAKDFLTKLSTGTYYCFKETDKATQRIWDVLDADKTPLFPLPIVAVVRSTDYDYEYPTHTPIADMHPADYSKISVSFGWKEAPNIQGLSISWG